MSMLYKRRGSLSNLRERLRATFFDALRHVAAIDDSRQLLSTQMHLHNAVPVNEDFSSLLQEASAYPDLGQDSCAVETRLRSDIVFVTGRYRSGSTLLWNIFRHMRGVTSYYEPFNERRWFDPAKRGTLTDSTHVGVGDYWAEYEGLQGLARVFDDKWKFRHLYMTDASWNAPMQEYIESLVEAASGRPVLQFNEVDYRLPWLRARFPNAGIVHIYRHPREQWCSTLGAFRGDEASLTVGSFEALDGFYLLRYARDLRHYFPFLDLARDTHPYKSFYQLWKLSFLFGRRYADFSLSLEELVESPGSTITRMLKAIHQRGDAIGELAGLVQQGGLRRRSPAMEDRYRQIEEDVDREIRDFFNAGPPAESTDEARGERPKKRLNAVHAGQLTIGTGLDSASAAKGFG